MANKIFGVKNITHLLYGILVLLPMFAILGRVIYTQSNPNAKDSYSSQKITKQQKITNNLVEGLTYYVQPKYETHGNSAITKFSSFVPDNDFVLPDYATQFMIYTTSTSAYLILWYDDNNTQLTASNWGNPNGGNAFNSFTFTYSATATNNALYNFVNLYYFTFQNDGLDNAFEYSLKSFTDDNNLGEVDMFSWFTDLFLDHSNVHNQIYIGFVNWYLNYTMLVSCGYLFFLVLIWFVNFVRKILDKSMYQDYGGF